MENWEERVLAGDFNAIPAPFRWSRSARLAHLFPAYEKAGGFCELANLASEMSAQRMVTGEWQGDARQLWMCLFFQHRATRHSGHEPAGDELNTLNDLCEALRRKLQSLSSEQARALSKVLRPEA